MFCILAFKKNKVLMMFGVKIFENPIQRDGAIIQFRLFNLDATDVMYPKNASSG